MMAKTTSSVLYIRCCVSIVRIVNEITRERHVRISNLEQCTVRGITALYTVLYSDSTHEDSLAMVTLSTNDYYCVG